MKEATALDALITVVDARHVGLHIEESTECQEQIAFADVILLNKTDLLSPGELAELERRIRNVNRFARIVPTERCALPIEQILDIGAFDLERALEIDPAFLSETAHEHDSTVTSVGMEIEGDMDEQKLEAWMRTLLRERGVDIFRMKGIMSVGGKDRELVMQGVHMLLEGALGRLWSGGKRSSRLVFIGRNLDRHALGEGFRGCLL
jgi:G3E family GTPase